MKTILVPVDFSPVTAAVTAQALALARAWRARLVLLTVTAPAAVMGDSALAMESGLALTAAAEAATAKNLARLRTRLGRSGLAVRTVALLGSPSLLIAEQAAKHRASCIVMGSHGHGAFYDLLLGSTTQGVLRRVRCPVLVVPPVRSGRAGA